MNRRDALRTLAGAAAAPLLAPAAFAELLEAGRRVRESMPPAGSALRTLSEQQNRTVGTLAEIIVPETDIPGAAGARVNEFIDLLLSDWLDEEDRDAFLAGLDGLDDRARDAFGSAFVDCTEAQQTEMVAAMDAEVAELLEADEAARHEQSARARAAAERMELAEPAAAVLEGAATGDADTQEAASWEPRAPDHFFYQMKRWTLTGYFTSDVGMRQALGYQIIPGRWEPCIVIEEG